MKGRFIGIDWGRLAHVLGLLMAASTVSCIEAYSQGLVIVDGVTPQCVVNEPGQVQHPGPDAAKLFPSPLSGHCSGSIKHNCVTARGIGGSSGSAFETIPTACVGTFTSSFDELLAEVKKIGVGLELIAPAIGTPQHVVKYGFVPGTMNTCALSGANASAECDVTVWSDKDTGALITNAQQSTDKKLRDLNAVLALQIATLQANLKALADANDAVTKRLNDMETRMKETMTPK